MKKRKQRRTITGMHFVEKPPDRRRSESAPTNPIPPGRAYIKRMSWGFAPGVIFPSSITRIARTLSTTSAADAMFFVDSCFIRDPIDEKIWQAVAKSEIGITPLVYDEIQTWMTLPGRDPVNAEKVKERLSNTNSRITRVLDNEDIRRYGYTYYISLLASRKLKGRELAEQFATHNGRLPSAEEFYPAFKQSSRGLDDRSARIGWKGVVDYDKRNYLADEQTVVMAVLFALMTGRETTILTRDHDLMDQFYKLIFLIDTHYRSMLFAELYNADRSAFSPQNRRTIVEDYPEFLEDRFIGDDDLFMRPNLPKDTQWDSLLPAKFNLVNITCAWFGGSSSQPKVSQMGFCADRGMAAVCRVKDATGGLNSNLLGGKNCHIWPCPDFQDVLGHSVAITSDKIIKYHPNVPEYRVIDLIHSISSREGFDLVKIEGANETFPFSTPGPTTNSDRDGPG